MPLMGVQPIANSAILLLCRFVRIRARLVYSEVSVRKGQTPHPALARGSRSSFSSIGLKRN